MSSLSIVIPAYNEEKRLGPTLEGVLRFLEVEKFDFSELIVVDDGSRDKTAELVERFARDHGEVRLLRNPGNRGKGFSIRQAMLDAKGEWILYTDADLSAPIFEFVKLFEAAQKTGARVAIGSRALDRSLVGKHQSAFREISGRAFNLFMRGVTGLPFRDTQCGFKLFERSAAREIFSRQVLDGFSFDVEDLVIAKTLGIKTVEVPVVWNNVEGTKVGMLSGVQSFADLIGIRWRALNGRYNR